MSVLRWVSKTSLGRELAVYSATALGAREKMKAALASGERLVDQPVAAEPASTLHTIDRRRTS